MLSGPNRFAQGSVAQISPCGRNALQVALSCDNGCIVVSPSWGNFRNVTVPGRSDDVLMFVSANRTIQTLRLIIIISMLA